MKKDAHENSMHDKEKHNYNYYYENDKKVEL